MSLFKIEKKDAFLFSGTLKMNLDPFGKFTDEKLWEALEKAHLKSFVEGLDKKLLFECSEGGDNLRYFHFLSLLVNWYLCIVISFFKY